jgi:hypothetical protein
VDKASNENVGGVKTFTDDLFVLKGVGGSADLSVECGATATLKLLGDRDNDGDGGEADCTIHMYTDDAPDFGIVISALNYSGATTWTVDNNENGTVYPLIQCGKESGSDLYQTTQMNAELNMVKTAAVTAVTKDIFPIYFEKTMGGVGDTLVASGGTTGEDWISTKIIAVSGSMNDGTSVYAIPYSDGTSYVNFRMDTTGTGNLYVNANDTKFSGSTLKVVAYFVTP